MATLLPWLLALASTVASNESSLMTEVVRRPIAGSGPERVVIRRENVELRSEGAVLKGALRVPAIGEIRPALVILGGSSWKTRANVMWRARNLAALGFVTLAFDQRGYGESTGERVVPFEVTARDALAGVRLLKARPDVDPAAVGIIAVSRGGWQAPLAARLSDDVRFLILLVPGAVSPAEQETSRRLAVVRQAGFGEEDVVLAERLLAATWRWARTGEGWAEYLELRAQAVARRLPRDVFQADSRAEERWRWARLNMFFEPCPVLAAVRVPVLALFGSEDTVVDTAVNRPRLLECLASGGNADVTARIIEGVGHDLVRRRPAASLPWDGDESMAPIAEWGARRFRALQ